MKALLKSGKGLTDKQRDANRLLGGPQRHTLLIGGASSGKTFTILRRIMARGLPTSNIANLPEGTVEELSRLPPRQRKRFYLGEYSEEIEGALWTFEALDRGRIDRSEVPKTLRQVVVAVDPSGTSGDEEKRSDDAPSSNMAAVSSPGPAPPN
ncbi:MAG: hypothetical protein JOY83_14345 [Alphaproteobacteria bacterium]|nr:hypothetical protein [Alphaproteobacteria bacterium]